MTSQKVVAGCQIGDMLTVRMRNGEKKYTERAKKFFAEE